MPVWRHPGAAPAWRNAMAVCATQAAMNPLSIRPAQPPAQATMPDPGPQPGGLPPNAPLWRHVAQGAWITLGAFSLPTMLSPCVKGLLSPRAFALRTLLGGFIYIDMIQPPQQVRFAPAPTIDQEIVALTLGMTPYIAAFYAQARLANGWCSRDGSSGAQMAAASQRFWQRLCGFLPVRLAPAARGYPINFVLARVTAQMLAVSAGSLMSACFHHARGARLEPVARPAGMPSLRQRIEANPAAYLACGPAFASSVWMTLRLDRAAARAGGALPPALVALLASHVVAACIATALIHPRPLAAHH
ncbi:hypothetical protein ABC383_15355 [Noviherbaspirillum sp. 1P10PC]|uniref:hypothetical protein n=1 Tax=Noviherbaspirillum sp. 1P10PC TaxID=3132292 RepID=UPI0039A36C68